MGVLEESLVKHLLNTSASYKRDEMEQRIRLLLSATPLATVKGLPARRGAADGGIDGIMEVSHLENQKWVHTQVAALNVKVRKSSFTREQLGGFLLDLDRERIFIGIIITASKLSPDALVEMERKNSEGVFSLYHLSLTNILSGEVDAEKIKVGGYTVNGLLTNNLKSILI